MILLGSASRRCRRGRPGARAMGMSPLTIFGASTELWLRSDKGIVTVSGAVSQWRDQSGKGRHFSQATADSRPTYNASDSNWGGLPSLTFDGTDDYMVSEDAASVWRFLHDGTGGAAIVVWRPSSVPTSGAVRPFGTHASASQTGASPHYSFGLQQLQYLISNGTTNIISAHNVAMAKGANHWHVSAYEEGRSPAESGTYVDSTTAGGTSDSSGAPDTGDSSTTAIVGSSALSGDFARGEILEVIVASVYPSAAQLAQLEEYLDARYGFSDPASIFGADLELWLKSTDGVTVDGSGNVSAWADQSGNGRDFSQGTAGSRPAYNTTDANWGGKPSLTFDGTGDHLISDDAASVWKFLHDGSGAFVLAVVRTTTATGSCALAGTHLTAGTDTGVSFERNGTADKYDLFIRDAGTNTLTGSTGSSSSSDNANEYTYWAYEEGRAGNERVIAVGDTSLTGDSLLAPSASDPTATLHIGEGAPASTHSGEIVEFIVASVYPSDTQLYLLGRYMNKKYGL